MSTLTLLVLGIVVVVAGFALLRGQHVAAVPDRSMLRLAQIVESGQLLVTAAPGADLPAVLEELDGALQAHGFAPAGLILTRPGQLRVTISATLIDADGCTFARLTAPPDQPVPLLAPAPTCALISHFVDGQQLITTSLPRAVAIPTQHHQLRPGASVATLVELHRARLAAMIGSGLQPVRFASAEQLVDITRQEWFDDVRGYRSYGMTSRSS